MTAADREVLQAPPSTCILCMEIMYRAAPGWLRPQPRGVLQTPLSFIRRIIAPWIVMECTERRPGGLTGRGPGT
jgi:hypothetical protein